VEAEAEAVTEGGAGAGAGRGGAGAGRGGAGAEIRGAGAETGGAGARARRGGGAGAAPRVTTAPRIEDVIADVQVPVAEAVPAKSPVFCGAREFSETKVKSVPPHFFGTITTSATIVTLYFITVIQRCTTTP